MSIEPKSVKHHSIYLESIQELHNIHREILQELTNTENNINLDITSKGLITPNILYQQKLQETISNQNNKE